MENGLKKSQFNKMFLASLRALTWGLEDMFTTASGGFLTEQKLNLSFDFAE